jgi:hypothetical protein
MRRGSFTQGLIASRVPVLPPAVLLLTGLLCGCSLIIDLEPNQCQTDADCTKLGLGTPCTQGVCALTQPRAGCDAGPNCTDTNAQSMQVACDPMHLCAKPDQVCFKDACALASVAAPFVCTPAPAGDPNGMIVLTTHVQEFISTIPPKGLVVAACRASDVNCTDSVANWVDNRASGDLVLQLPYGFDGFLRVQSDETLTAMYFMTRPLTNATHLKTFEVVAPSTLATLAAVTGYTADAQKGLVILEAFDCAGNAAGGIRFEESKQDGVPFFIVDSRPNIDSKLSVRDDIQDSAIGGFLNASAGFTIFSARIGASGPLLGRFNANVRANTVTYLDFHP